MATPARKFVYTLLAAGALYGSYYTYKASTGPFTPDKGSVALRLSDYQAAELKQNAKAKPLTFSGKVIAELASDIGTEEALALSLYAREKGIRSTAEAKKELRSALSALAGSVQDEQLALDAKDEKGMKDKELVATAYVSGLIPVYEGLQENFSNINVKAVEKYPQYVAALKAGIIKAPVAPKATVELAK